MAASMVLLAAPPASAIPADTNWAVTPPPVPVNTVFDVSTGADAAPGFRYNMNPAGLSIERTWTFQAVATTSGTVTLPYTWQGSHAYHNVLVRLEKFDPTNGSTIVRQESNLNCCAPPSASFLWGGIVSFEVTEGQPYGFRLTGRNFDSNNFLQGTFTLSTKPYIDANIGGDNRDWLNAETIGTPENPTGRNVLRDPGEARWYKFKVVPGESVSARLSDIPIGKDYDLALYGDIADAFDRLAHGSEEEQLAATAAAAGVTDTTEVKFPEVTATIPTKADPPDGITFAPRVYAPRVYAPRVYAPRVYAPRVYAPRVYAPRVYAPSNFLPEVTDDSFSEAYSAAQSQTLLAVSTNTGDSDETLSATTGNTAGWFYLRVQGHDDGDFHATDEFIVSSTSSNAPACDGVLPKPEDNGFELPSAADTETVILTDTSRFEEISEAEREALKVSLQQLAGLTEGVVLDVAGNTQIEQLWIQVGAHNGCTYAVNLVAEAIKELADTYRNGNSNSKYVVIAGGDDIVPFFRYPDTSGLGQESEFVPPVNENTPSGASLNHDQVQSQDAYGSDKSVTIGGTTLPLPDLAVGRLVETPAEIIGAVANYDQLMDTDTPGVLPRADSTLVTGYDFLTDAANAVGTSSQVQCPLARNVRPHQRHLVRRGSRGGPAAHRPGRAPELVYLAGHFSANDTLAADFDTTLNANLLDPDPAKLPALGKYAGALHNTLVLRRAATPATTSSTRPRPPGRT